MDTLGFAFLKDYSSGTILYGLERSKTGGRATGLIATAESQAKKGGIGIRQSKQLKGHLESKTCG